jgi:hypothetical protein
MRSLPRHARTGGRLANHCQQAREFDEGHHRHLRDVHQLQRRAVLWDGHPLRQEESRPVREMADEMVANRPPLPSRRREGLPEPGMPLIVDDDRPWKLRSMS